MNDIVGAIRSQSSSTDELKKLNKFLQLDSSVKTIKKNAGQIDQALEVLDYTRNTLGVLHLLAIKIQFEIKNHNDFFEQCLRALRQGDNEQVAMAPQLFATVCKAFTQSVIITERFMRAIQPLQLAIQKIMGASPNLLTSVHANFALVCLKAKCYSTALSTLDSPLYEIKPKENGIEPVDYLQYFYYGGIIYMGLKKFAKAQEFFQMVLTCPSRVLSALQVEAFKRYVVAGLLSSGEVSPLPKFTSPAVARSVERVTQPYLDLSRAYKKASVEVVHKVMAENAELFKKDKMWGLLKQVQDLLIRRNIQKLTSTYLTVSLNDIAQNANLKTAQAAEKIVLTMVEEGTISASIDQKNGMVIFLDANEEYDSSQQVSELDAKIQEVTALSEKLKSVDKTITLNQKYLLKTVPGLTAAMQGGQGGAMGPLGALGAAMGMGGMSGMGMGMPMGMGMGMPMMGGPMGMGHGGMGAGMPMGMMHDQEDAELKFAMEVSAAAVGHP